MNISRGTDLLVNNDSLTQDEINDILHNNLIIHAQKSALSSAATHKREDILTSNIKISDIQNKNEGK